MLLNQLVEERMGKFCFLMYSFKSFFSVNILLGSSIHFLDKVFKYFKVNTFTRTLQ